MKKIKLCSVKRKSGGFWEVELAPECILSNYVILPWESNRSKTSLYVIGNEYGALCAVWADNESEAIDVMVDKGLGDSFLVDEDTFLGMSKEEQEELAHVGNAGEPADLTHCWISEVDISKLEVQVLCMFAECRGGGYSNLDCVT